MQRAFDLYAGRVDLLAPGFACGQGDGESETKDRLERDRVETRSLTSGGTRFPELPAHPSASTGVAASSMRSFLPWGGGQGPVLARVNGMVTTGRRGRARKERRCDTAGTSFSVCTSNLAEGCLGAFWVRC